MAVDEMKHSRCHTLFSYLLAVLMISGLSLSTVQSNNMDIKMAMSADMDNMKTGGCDSCPGGGDSDAAGCAASCALTVFALLPSLFGLVHMPLPGGYSFSQSAARDGPASTEPDPPKPYKYS